MMSVRLYVGNLPKEAVERQALQDVFIDLGDSVTVKVIKDRKTNKCRGFAFVTVPSDEIADEFIEKYNGQPFMESPLKIEKALPRTKGKGKDEGGEETDPQETEVNLTEGVEAPVLAQGAQEEEAVEAKAPAPVIAKPSAPVPERKRSTSTKKQRPPRGQQKTVAGATKTYTSGDDNESIQPDPRWASELAKLKDMLSTQTANT